ncbi:MAG: phosphatase domain-containing protein [Erythrobacter sp.]|jgi:phosphatidate phosphatase APP1|nr:phosphatase domain-containing protein [Erythrobacter sp.]
MPTMLRRFFSRSAPVRVEPFFGFRNATTLYLTTRAIRAPEPVFERRNFVADFATMAGQYFSREVAGLPVELEYECADGTSVSKTLTTGPEGFARFELDITPACDQPPRTRWERATIRWSASEHPGESGEVSAYILTPGTQTLTGVISDIDDTILETGITGDIRAILRNWKRVMAQMPSQRMIVPGASDFYAAIGGRPETPHEAKPNLDELVPRARVRPVFYVSSSPWNLFSYLVTFKRQRGLPLGPVMLRDWGFNRKTLGKEGHGSHKRTAILEILAAFPHLRFALIGDDSQKDLVAFGKIAAEQPDRIAAIFIRSISEEPLSAEQVAAKQAIGDAGVPFWTGSNYAQAHDFLAEAGLDFEGGVERLVETASEGKAVSRLGVGVGNAGRGGARAA